ncbi:MAG: C40 family peptidase [Caldimonas sp.]
MLSHRPAPCPRLARVVVALVVASASVAAPAAPGDGDDPIARFAQPQLQSQPPPPAAAGLLGSVPDRASELVLAAMNFVGLRYRRGGESADTGFDCSGFTRHVFNMTLGLALPRRADEQAAAPGLVPVKLADLQPGDLVFFRTMKQTFSHVGIYIGSHRFIHSPRSGETIRTDDMSFAYWAKRFTGARRAELPGTTVQTQARANDVAPLLEPSPATAPALSN